MIKDISAQLLPMMPPFRPTVGASPHMVFDRVRNKFYRDLIRKEVKGKVCAESGFGTGLLVLYALRYGAKHVYAYEIDPTMFEIGKKILEEMGADFSRVTLIQGAYKDEHDDVEILIQERVDRALWGEQIINTYPTRAKIIPGLLGCKIKSRPGHLIPERIKKLKNQWLNKTIRRRDVRGKFKRVMRQMIRSNEYTSYDSLVRAELFDEPVYEDTILGSYSIDLNKGCPDNFITVPIVIDNPDTLIWCDYSMNDWSITENPTCWKPDKVVVKHRPGKVTFVQDTRNGAWWLE